ncbi:two-component sensor histidine kinase [Rhodoferax koreense]|uniref:histidine kinase n=1 Tax=Rhodoferax koreensis TaxID=1842727 RepID=A0A1P8JYL2_9BURK|nr:ATP-binding protein [Rhodoferax koreense]APW38835.1 two-component sensor histidine kinase [Rhodoferax koreense]
MTPSPGSATHSLRRRLLLSVMTAIVLAALFQAVSAYRGALRQADEMFDYHLQQMALSMRARMPQAPSKPAPPPVQEHDDATSADSDIDYLVQIWGADGIQLFRSSRSALPPRAVLGFSDVVQGGTTYRVYSIQTPFQTIQIAQDMSARQSRARALALRAMLPMALIAPLLMLVIWAVIRQSLSPLERTRRQVAARTAEDLSPLADNGLPDEVRPLVQELNLLFDRMHTVLQAQKAFVANAAHELRTPLTALKLQAQALHRAPDEATRDVAIGRLNQGIERSIRMMNQLLALARQEGNEAAPLQTVDLRPLTQAIATEMQGQALARGIDLRAAEGPAAPVRGDAEALRILLRNLLENAIKYTPEGGSVRVDAASEARMTRLVVEDSGPGIPEADRERVFERFYRSPDAMAGTGGSGLGLSIVKAIAMQHGATTALDASPSLGGLRATVNFAAP